MIKKLFIILVIVIAVACIFLVGMRVHTKSFSPIDTAKYEDDKRNIEVTYCRPFKKGRMIFPEMIPYGEIWRTGANEATKITTATDLIINDKTLPGGTYSIWTRPGKDNWEIIFNKEYGQWGLTAISGEANRNPDLDILSITVPVYHSKNNIEQFTIQFETWGEVIEMLLMWDHTIVVIQIKKD